MRTAYLAWAAAACLACAGCGGGREDYKYRIVVIPKGMTHEFWQSIHRGADRAAADLKDQRHLDVQVIWDGPNKESDIQEQISIINRQLAAHVLDGDGDGSRLLDDDGPCQCGTPHAAR